MENTDDLRLLLVTANVGTLFEMAKVLTEVWITEFCEVRQQAFKSGIKQGRTFITCVARRRPTFIALHCQEIGGKKVNEETVLKIKAFSEALHSQDVFTGYDRGQNCIDAELQTTGKFTALGSFYFVHKSVRHAHIWDFKRQQFEELQEYTTVALPLSADDRCTVLKLRFPLDLHPLAKGSRKGFMTTRWKVDDRIFDLINIHMFHDENNFVAMESSPSSYTEARKAGLQYVLNTLNEHETYGTSFFLFGDFNFRLDSHEVVKKLTESGFRQEITGNGAGDDSLSTRRKVCYMDNQNGDKLLLTVEKKIFDYNEAQDVFHLDNGKWLRSFDNELSAFSELHEEKITFPPSYPYEEDVCKGTSFMKTRCPAWCDRILMNSTALNLIDRKKEKEYNLIGPSVCMGDHKPVFLLISLIIEPDAGRDSRSSSLEADKLPSTDTQLESSETRNDVAQYG